jgi:hypothetical protein
MITSQQNERTELWAKPNYGPGQDRIVARRHGLKPYRHPRQRCTTVMVRVEKVFLDTIVWPQYLELSELLHTYLSETTQDIISQSIHNDLTDATE